MGCNPPEDKMTTGIQYVDGELIVNLDDPKFRSLKEIKFVSKNPVNNHLDIKFGKIDKIKNVVQVSKKKDYINSWVKLDHQGNIDFTQSYFYETFLSADDTMVYVNCSLEKVLLNDAKYFVVVSKFDKKFNSLNSKFDTIAFNQDFIAKIPFPQWKKGKNNIRFIIVQEKLNGNVFERSKTYCDKDFYVE